MTIYGKLQLSMLNGASGALYADGLKRLTPVEQLSRRCKEGHEWGAKQNIIQHGGTYDIFFVLATLEFPSLFSPLLSDKLLLFPSMLINNRQSNIAL